MPEKLRDGKNDCVSRSHVAEALHKFRGGLTNPFPVDRDGTFLSTALSIDGGNSVRSFWLSFESRAAFRWR